MSCARIAGPRLAEARPVEESETCLRFLVLAVGLAIAAAIALAVRYHFQSGARPARFRILLLFSTINVFAFARALWLTKPPAERLWAALVLFIAAAALFAWTIAASRRARLKLIYETDEPQAVLKDGPYRFIRHPFYASYIVFWTGCALATLDPVNIAFAATIVPVLAMAALAEEAQFARSPEAAAYAAYRREAGLFWPKLF